MRQKIGEQISVVMLNNRSERALPYGFKWQNNLHKVKDIDSHYLMRSPEGIFHVYSVTDGEWNFRLKFDAESLEWTLDEVSDENYTRA